MEISFWSGITTFAWKYSPKDILLSNSFEKIDLNTILSILDKDIFLTTKIYFVSGLSGLIHFKRGNILFKKLLNLNSFSICKLS
jgi:hypothetical protein